MSSKAPELRLPARHVGPAASSGPSVWPLRGELRAAITTRRAALRSKLLRELEEETDNLRRAADALREQREKLLRDWTREREELKQQLAAQTRQEVLSELSIERERQQEQFAQQRDQLTEQRRKFDEHRTAEMKKLERDQQLTEQARQLARMEIERTHRRQLEELQRHHRQQEARLQNEWRKLQEERERWQQQTVGKAAATVASSSPAAEVEVVPAESQLERTDDQPESLFAKDEVRFDRVAKAIEDDREWAALQASAPRRSVAPSSASGQMKARVKRGDVTGGAAGLIAAARQKLTQLRMR